jgi:hypothetical protein
MSRDSILFSEFLPASRAGFKKIEEAYDFAEVDYLTLEYWALFTFLLRVVPDSGEYFPHGKWATIQAVESKLNEWADQQKAAGGE